MLKPGRASLDVLLQTRRIRRPDLLGHVVDHHSRHVQHIRQEPAQMADRHQLYRIPQTGCDHPGACPPLPRRRHPGRRTAPAPHDSAPQPHTGRRQPPAPLTGTPTAQTINLCGTSRSIGTFPAHGPHGPSPLVGRPRAALAGLHPAGCGPAPVRRPEGRAAPGWRHGLIRFWWER